MDRKTIDATLETLRLKEESRLMEERLAVLKNLMTAEKASRRAASSAYWASGQKGPLKKSYAAEQRKAPPKTTKIRILTDTNAGSPKVIPLCDKCSKYRPSVSCLECTEDYCSACFIRLHQNGALADHHASPILQQTNPTKQWRGNKCVEVCDCTVEDNTYNEPGEHNRENLGDTPSQGGSLLQGTYDEEASAASFQEALREWRAAGHDSKGNQEQQTISVRDSSTAPRVSTEVQSMLLHIAPNTIEFTSGGVSYLEKLMIRSHRVDPSFLPNLLKKRSPSGRSMPEWEGLEGMEQQPSQYNIFYSAETELLPSETTNGIEPFDLQSCQLDVENIHFPLEKETINHATVTTTDAVTTTTTTIRYTSSSCEPPESAPTVRHKRAEQSSLAGSSDPSTAPKVHKLGGQDNSNSAKPVGVIPQLGDVKTPLPETAMLINGTGDQQVTRQGTGNQQVTSKGTGNQQDTSKGTGSQQNTSKGTGDQQNTSEMTGNQHNIGCGTGDQQESDHETLSGFFLSEVEPRPSYPPHPQAIPHHVASPSSNHGNTSGGHSSEFRLGTVVWLPESSWLSTNREASIPSPVASREQGADNDDPSSHEGASGDEVCSVEDVGEGWDDRDDLEAIESLAWELSSNVDGRMTQSSVCKDEEGEWSEEVDTSISTVSVDQVMEQFDLYRKSVMSQES